MRQRVAGPKVSRSPVPLPIRRGLSIAGGQASDIEITVNEVKKIKRELYEVIVQHTGQPYDKVAADCNRDFWMNSTEAKEYGIVDEVLTINPRKAKKD